jgi:hypothetical protein
MKSKKMLTNLEFAMHDSATGRASHRTDDGWLTRRPNRESLRCTSEHFRQEMRSADSSDDLMGERLPPLALLALEPLALLAPD